MSLKKACDCIIIDCSWDYIEDGGKVLEDMDRMDAFRKGLTTWAKWVDTYVDPGKTKVLYRGISPTHYE